MNEAAGFHEVPARHRPLPNRRRPTLARVLIPWSEVEGAEISPLYPIEYVRLHVRDAERYVQALIDAAHPLARLFGDGRGARAPELGLPVMGTPYGAEELCELIRAYAGGRRGG